MIILSTYSEFNSFSFLTFQAVQVLIWTKVCWLKRSCIQMCWNPSKNQFQDWQPNPKIEVDVFLVNIAGPMKNSKTNMKFWNISNQCIQYNVQVSYNYKRFSIWFLFINYYCSLWSTKISNCWSCNLELVFYTHNLLIRYWKSTSFTIFSHYNFVKNSDQR